MLVLKELEIKDNPQVPSIIIICYFKEPQSILLLNNLNYLSRPGDGEAIVVLE